MSAQELNRIAKAIIASGKGILAADESTGTMGKRLEGIGAPNSEENRRAYRDLLFTTPGAEDFIGGVILFDETLRQKATDGTPFSELLSSKGMIPGIKVDTGAKPLAGSHSEQITEGLDGLRERFSEYHRLGARFAKWRAVIEIDPQGRPSAQAIHANAEALARYAALSQEAGIVPIVEPEVLMDGTHTIERCYEVTHAVLSKVFEYLALHNVALEGMLLKPNMIIPGLMCSRHASPEEVAEATLACFKEVVPATVAGIVFLSGGQSELDATANLQAMNALGGNPWPLSYSYGRALQASALKAWRAEAANVPAAQAAFYHRAHMNTLAALGQHTAAAEEGQRAAC